jgi:hypothetical protein
MIRAGLLLLIVLLGATQAATAQNRSVSHSVWSIAADRVTVRFMLPASEARKIVARGAPPPSTEKVAQYVLDRLSVAASGTPCAAIDQGYDIGRIDTLAAGAGLYGFEVIFQCPNRGELLLGNAVLFESQPAHIDFAQIEADGHVTSQLFTAGHEQLRVAASSSTSAGFFEYLRLGIGHILHGIDRICFLIGMLLLARGGRDSLGIVAGLMFGYSVSVVVALEGDVVPSGAGIEAAMGFLIALIAAQIVARQVRPHLVEYVSGGALLLLAAVATQSRGAQTAWLVGGLGIFAVALLRLAAVHRFAALLVLAAAFGFWDGFALPGDYARLQWWHQIPSLQMMGFNVGAMLTNTLLVALCFTAYLLVRERKISMLGDLAKDFAVSALAGMGTFWMISRLYV